MTTQTKPQWKLKLKFGAVVLTLGLGGWWINAQGGSRGQVDPGPRPTSDDLRSVKVRVESNVPGQVAVTWIIGSQEGDDVPRTFPFERGARVSPGQFVVISAKPASSVRIGARTVVIIFQGARGEEYEVKRDASEGNGIAVAEWTVT